MVRVLVSDDNSKLIEPWKDRAYHQDIDLAFFSNWEEARYELETKWDDYEFIILDGKGKLSEDSPEANNKHVIASVQWLKEQKGNGKYKPAVIYTGYFNNIDEMVIKDDQILEVFDKEKMSIDDVFAFVLKNLKNSPLQIIRTKHPHIYDLINSNLLTRERRLDLQNIYEEIERNHEDNYINTFRKIRPIIESVIVRLKQLDNSILPDDLFQGEPEVSRCIKFLAGNLMKTGTKYVYTAPQHMPEHIFYIADFLQKATSKAAMHHYEKSISPHIVKSCAEALSEFLKWYKYFADKLN